MKMIVRRQKLLVSIGLFFGLTFNAHLAYADLPTNSKYEITCDFIEARISESRGVIEAGSAQYKTLIKANYQKSSEVDYDLYEYEKSGLLVEYIKSKRGDGLVLLKTLMPSSFLYESIRNKNSFLDYFGVNKNQGDSLLLGCDSLLMKVTFKNKDLMSIEIFPSFIN